MSRNMFLFMILRKKYEVRLFIILTHFKDRIWYCLYAYVLIFLNL